MTLLEDLKKKAKKIIKNNSRGNFTIPCDTLYPFQWNWDSAFSALGIFSYDKERAMKEIDYLFKGQWDDGMIPQIIFHNHSTSYYPGPDVWKSNTNPLTSCITQPPVVSSIVWKMITFGLEDKEKLDAWFQCLFRYHVWFVKYRDPYQTGLVSLFHPWESGRDNSPDWDNALRNIPVDKNLEIPRKDDTHINDTLRPTDDDYNRYMQIVFKCASLNWNNHEIYHSGLFNVCDPGVQFMFVRACKDLLKIANYLSDYNDKSVEINHIEMWIERFEKGCQLLWNKDLKAYSTLDLKTNDLFHGISCGSMLYAYADIGDKYQRKYMLQHSRRILFHTKYGFPSWDSTDPRFDVKRYWRGPVWCIMNYLLATGFDQQNEFGLAEKIRNYTMKLIENFGFFEYFDPHSGRGYGGDNFSWTAAIYLVLLNDKA